MRLLSSHGEELDSATLFVHVTITNLNDAAAVSMARGQFNPFSTTIKISILPTDRHTWPLMLVLRIWRYVKKIFPVDDLISSLGLFP